METSLSIATPPFEAGSNALPNAAPAPQGDGASRQAWQREMERVQAERWFQHAPTATASAPQESPHDAESAPAPESRPPTQLPRPPLAWTSLKADGSSAARRTAFGNGTLSGTMYSFGGASGAAPAPEAQCAPSAQEASALTRFDVRSGVSAPPAASLKDGPEPSADATAATARPQDLRERAPVRVHLQWDDGVAHVWVGVDRRMDSGRSAVALAVLRQLRDQGITVGRLTCNGSDVPLDPAHQDAAPIFTVSTAHPDTVTHTKQREF